MNISGKRTIFGEHFEKIVFSQKIVFFPKIRFWSYFLLSEDDLRIGVSLIVTGGHVPFLVVNVTSTDFVSFVLIPQHLVHRQILFKLACNFCEAFIGSESTDKTAVSSAKVPIRTCEDKGRSAVKIRYRIGTITLP